MDREFFGIDPDGRQAVAVSKRRTGFVAEELEYKDLNELLFKLQTDHIIGTNAQLVANDCTCKYQSSDQTLRDSSGTEVTLTDGDRVYIIGLDTLTDDFDLSAYDRLRVVSDPSITLGNGSYNIELGDGCFIDILVADLTKYIFGTGCYGFINTIKYPDPIRTTSFWHTQNGYGSSGTKIQKFTTEVDPSNDTVVSIENSGAAGFYITANMVCYISVTYTSQFNTAGDLGISKNSSQLTTGIGSISAADRLAMATTWTANVPLSVHWSGVLYSGDIIRPHAGGAADGVAAAQGSISVTAVQIPLG